MAASLPRELERLPVNFNFGVTRDGRIFFIDDRVQTTSWLHPLTGKPIQTGHKIVQGLPTGWEQAVTPEGAVYYIDHNSTATTFEHPITGRTANHALPPPPTRSPPQSPIHSPSSKKPQSPGKNRPLKAPSASRDDSSMVTMRGWLYRQESGIKPWKKRWCVLADFGLFVYKDDKEQNSIGSILLPSYRIHQCTASDTSRKFAFKTEHDNMKTYLFASDNQDDMNRWINALKLAAMLKGPPIKEKEKNNNTTKLIPKSAFMEWEDVGTDALAKVGRAQQAQDGRIPNSVQHLQSPRQPQTSDHHQRMPPNQGDISQNSQSAFDPYQGHAQSQDPRLNHPGGYNPHNRDPRLRNQEDPRVTERDHNRDPRQMYRDSQNEDPRSTDPRMQHHGRSDRRNDDPHLRDRRMQHSSGPGQTDQDLHFSDPRMQHPGSLNQRSNDSRLENANEFDQRNHDPHFRDPRLEHPGGHDERDEDPHRREPDRNSRYPDQNSRQYERDPRHQHPSGYDSYSSKDNSFDYDPRNPRHSRNDPHRQIPHEQSRGYDPHTRDRHYPSGDSNPHDNRDRSYDEGDARFYPQASASNDRERRDEYEAEKRSEKEPPYARVQKPSMDPRKHHHKENGYIPNLDRGSDHDHRGRPIDRRYPENDRRIRDEEDSFQNHTDENPYMHMRSSERDKERDRNRAGESKRSSVQKLQDWQRQELDRHKYGLPSKPDLVPSHKNDGSQNDSSEYFGYYSPKQEAFERKRISNLQESRSNDTLPRDTKESEDGYSTLTKYQTRDSHRPQPQESHPRPDNRIRSDSSSPKQNPDLMIDVGHTYVNFPSDSFEDSRNDIPNRPPLPTAVRQQIVEELAQTKTPHTSKELIDAERALERRMQQPAYFDYPTPIEANKTFLQGLHPSQSELRSSDQGNRYEDRGQRNVRGDRAYNDPRYQDRGDNYQEQVPRDYEDQNVSRSLFGHPPSARVEEDLRMIERHQTPYSDGRSRHDASSDNMSEPKSEKISQNVNSQLYKSDVKTTLSDPSAPGMSSPHAAHQRRNGSSREYADSVTDDKQKHSNASLDRHLQDRNNENDETTPKQNLFADEANVLKQQSTDQGLDRSSTASLRLSLHSMENPEDRRSAFRPLQTSRPRDDSPPKHAEQKDESRYVPFPGTKSREEHDETDVKKRLSTASSQGQGHPQDNEGLKKGDNYNRMGREQPKGIMNAIHTVKEDPDMPDSDVIETELPKIGSRYPALSGQRLRMSICASDLIGKTHDELVLMLIQLRREYTSLEKELNFFREKLEQKRPAEHHYRRLRQESDGPFSEPVEIEHRQYKQLKFQCEEVAKKLEVFRPIVNLVHNMVNMGSLYGGDNFMLASQYRKHLLSPEEITPPKKMLEFSRKHQEQQIVQGIKDDIKQLTSDEVDLEDKLERLYELDRLIQEQSFQVTSLQEDRDLLDKALQGVLKQQDLQRDNPRELDRLIYQQRTVEKELSKVMHELAKASKELEETTAENNKIEHEVALLRSKVNDDLSRSKSAPSLSDENVRTKMMMEKDLAKVQNIMVNLNQQGARLSEAMNTLRRSSAGAALGSALGADNKEDPRKQKSTYMETDVDSSETKDLAQVAEILQGFQSQRSLISNDPREEQLSPTVTVGLSSKPHSFRTTQPRHNMLDNELNTDAIEDDVQDGPWDISDADDNTKRFYGIIPKEKPQLLTVRDVKRQSEQRKARDKLRKDDWNLDAENMDEDQGYGTGGSSKYSDGNNPIYENLPPERKSWSSIQPSKNKSSDSKRRSSLVNLVTPRPFVPYNSQNAAPISSLTIESPLNLGYNSLRSPSSDDGIVKATRVIIQPAFASDSMDSDSTNERINYAPKGWSPVKTGLFNVKRTPQGRYMTISSSEPIKLETSLIQPATLHTSAGDLITANTMDIPDIVKSSTTQMNQIDDTTIEREILAVPEKVFIPERYMPESDEEEISDEEMMRRQERSEKIKRILTQQSVHSISQPDVSKVADQVHQQVQQEKIKRAQLLEVSQELARQVTIKSRQAAAERRKTWSGSPSKKSEEGNYNQMNEDLDLHNRDYSYDDHNVSENMYI